MLQEPIRLRICLDDPKEYAYAIAKSAQEAKERFRTLYILSDGVFLYATSEYQKGWLAHCYPGGRIENRFGLRNLPDTLDSSGKEAV